MVVTDEQSIALNVGGCAAALVRLAALFWAVCWISANVGSTCAPVHVTPS